MKSNERHQSSSIQICFYPTFIAVSYLLSIDIHPSIQEMAAVPEEIAMAAAAPGENQMAVFKALEIEMHELL